MRSLALAFATFIAALLIGFLASQPPAPKPADVSEQHFSALRAMRDVRAISRAPRPTGSAENARVRAYLLGRMQDLGLAVETQVGPLPQKSRERLNMFRAEPAHELTNLLGIFPGADRSRPALLLMAHHDSVGGSPGAADDAAGVAAALEIVRALKAHGKPARDVIVLLTDAEELGLDGAKLFFGSHRLRSRIGAVVNMEARGGGGRASMFETGRANGGTVELYRRSVTRPSANSLAVLVYERMPNNTDFTIAKRVGIAGFNFAFIGKSALYHSPHATPDRLDQGSLQDLGGQALGVAGALAFAAELPTAGENASFGDVLGLFVIAYHPLLGWGLLGLAASLLAFAWTRARAEADLGPRELLGGAATALALFLHSALLLRTANLLSGSGGSADYYDRLAALPQLELQALLLCVAALLFAMMVKGWSPALVKAAPAALLTAFGTLLGGWSPVLIGIGLAAAACALFVPAGGSGIWGRYMGFALLILLLASAIQGAAPTAGPLLAWPLLLAAASVAVAVAADPGLRSPTAVLPIMAAGALGGGQLLYLAHFTFLGVGAPMPEVMALYTLLVGLLLWPLLGAAEAPRLMTIGATILALAGAGIALNVRLDPLAATVPLYSEKR